VSLKQNRAFLLLFRRWYCLLNYIKSIRERVMFSIRNERVGHLYNFSEFMWPNSEKGYDGAHFILRCVFYKSRPKAIFPGLDLNTEFNFVILGSKMTKLQTYAILQVKDQHWPIIWLKFCSHFCNIRRSHQLHINVEIPWTVFVICVILYTCEKVKHVGLFMFKLKIWYY
jgi:hypothetical protein